MSLVICSNIESDASLSARDNSIFKPYNFRNALSSNMILPKNCQVALQSCKINLDGTISIGENARRFFQYIGKYIDGTTNNTLSDTTADPVLCDLFAGERGIKQVQVEQLAVEIQKSINIGIVHLLYKNQATVQTIRDAITNEFGGFEFKYDIDTNVDDVFPKTVNSWYKSVRSGTATANYTYNSGTGELTTVSHANSKRGYATVTGFDSPVSPNGGVVEYDITGCMNMTSAGGNASQAIAFVCGLSIGSNTEYPPSDRYFGPVSWRWNRGSDYLQGGSLAGLGRFGQLVKNYFDVCVFVGGDGLLRVFHTPNRSAVLDGPVTTRNLTGISTITEFEYFNAAVGSDFNTRYDCTTNASKIDSIEFTLDGETVKIIAKNSTDTLEHTIYEYDATRDKEFNIKAMGQNTYGTQPFMGIMTAATSFQHQLRIDRCDRVASQTDFDFRVSGKCGWWQQQEYEGNSEKVVELTSRLWNDYSVGSGTPSGLTYAQMSAGPPVVLTDRAPVLILQESSVYSGTVGANVASVFGFPNLPVVDGTIWTAPTGSDNFYKINSLVVPRLLSTRSIFVRLENFTQTSVNARQGNHSSIIAHLPRFDGQIETGRLYFEPKNLIYLDLNNPEPLNINSFDLSFVYSNEQYAESIVGQSIIVLHFKEKSK